MEVDAAEGGQPNRPDGRQPLQLRTLVSERAVLNRADGSARWSQGDSVVMAAVYGPRQANPRREDAEKAVVEVVFKPMVVVPRGAGGAAGGGSSNLAALQAAEGRVIERIVRGTVEAVVPLGLMPRTSIMVVMQVIQADGSLLACALNAACAALVDAGVQMLSLYSAVACAWSAGGTLLMDPDQAEEKAASSTITLVFPHHTDFSSAGAAQAVPPAVPTAVPLASCQPVVEDGLLSSETKGAFTVDQYLDAWEACRQGCHRVAEFCQMSLSRGFQTI